jgi:hypothetical protein
MFAILQWLERHFNKVFASALLGWFFLNFLEFCLSLHELNVSFLSNPLYEKLVYGFLALIALLLGIMIIGRLVKNRNEVTRPSKLSQLVVLPFFIFLIIFFASDLLTHQLPNLVTRIVGMPYEQINIFAASTFRQRYGDCRLRMKSRRVQGNVCIDKVLYDALLNGGAQPIKLVGKQSFFGIAVNKVISDVPSITIASGAKITEKIIGKGKVPMSEDVLIIKLFANAPKNYSLNENYHGEEFSPRALKFFPSELQAILNRMKVGGVSIVQCPTLSACGFKLDPQPYILEIELVSSSADKS